MLPLLVTLAAAAPAPPPPPALPALSAGWATRRADCPDGAEAKAWSEGRVQHEACAFDDGALHGPERLTWGSDRVMVRTWYAGVQHGPSITGTRTGSSAVVLRHETRRYGAPSGITWTWREDGGLLSAREHRPPEGTGRVWLWHPGGHLRSVSSEGRYGPVGWTWAWGTSGAACEPFELDGQSTGTYRHYGEVCTDVWSGPLERGSRVGVWTHEVGGQVVERGTYAGEGHAACKVGPWEAFEDGQRVALETWRGCRVEGEVRTWWPDGAPRSVGEIRGGMRVGCWTTWHPDGQRASQERYAVFDRYHTRLPVPQSTVHGRVRRWDAEGTLVQDEVVDGSSLTNRLAARQPDTTTCAGWGPLAPAAHGAR